MVQIAKMTARWCLRNAPTIATLHNLTQAQSRNARRFRLFFLCSPVARDVLQAIEKETFLVLPHKEVAEYVQRKGNDRDRWISGMQRLQTQFEDFLMPGNEKD